MGFVIAISILNNTNMSLSTSWIGSFLHLHCLKGRHGGYNHRRQNNLLNATFLCGKINKNLSVLAPNRSVSAFSKLNPHFDWTSECLALLQSTSSYFNLIYNADNSSCINILSGSKLGQAPVSLSHKKGVPWPTPTHLCKHPSSCRRELTLLLWSLTLMMGSFFRRSHTVARPLGLADARMCWTCLFHAMQLMSSRGCHTHNSLSQSCITGDSNPAIVRTS